MNTIQRIAKNTGLLFSANVISKVLSFFYIMYTARYLGVKGFGILSFALAFTGIFGVFADLGLGVLTVREVARDKSLATKYLANITVIKIILVAITFGLIVLIVNLLGYPQETIKVVYLITLSVICGIFTAMFNSIFRAFERMGYQFLGDILNSILMFCGVIIAMKQGFGVMGFASLYFMASVVVLGYSFSILRWRFFSPTFTCLLWKMEIDWGFWKLTIKKALPFGLTILFFTMYYRIDMIMLSMMKGNEAVGWYSVAHRLVFVFASISGAFRSSFFPVASRLYKSSKEVLVQSYERAFVYLLLIAVPIGVGTTILASRFIPLIYGAEYMPSIIALQILIWAGVINFVDIFGNLLGSIDQQTKMARVSFMCLMVNVALNFLLIPKYSYIGASVATVITCLVGILQLYRYVIRAGYRLSNSFLIKRILKVGVASIIMGTYIAFFQSVNLLVLVPSSIMFYFLSFYLLKGFDLKDMELLKNVLERRAVSVGK